MLLQSNVINQLHQAEELFDDEIPTIVNLYPVAKMTTIAMKLGGRMSVTWQNGGVRENSMGEQIWKCTEIP
jgi:hypothetical protein